LFPSGIDVPYDSFMDNIRATQRLLNQNLPLFEAGIMAKNLSSRIDILMPAVNGKWDIIDVKSSTSIKEVNIEDVAFRRYCCESQGIFINHCFLAYVYNKCIRNGAIDPAGLIKVEDITDLVETTYPKVTDKSSELLTVMSSAKCTEPGIGPHCSNPYQCALTECWDFLPEDNVFTLYRGGKKSFELYDNGTYSIKDIPDSFKLNDKQALQKTCEISTQP
jgi:hypothetical protein